MMITDIKKSIWKHSSIIVMGVGAIFIFSSNIFLKKYLNPNDYGAYSLFITYITLINSFGLLGLEQVFLRISNTKGANILETNKSLMIITLFVGVVFGILCSFFLSLFLKEINFLVIYGCTIGVSFSMLLYNILRLNSSFFLAQVLTNGWKIVLGVSVIIVTFFSSEIVLLSIVNVLLFALFGFLLIFGLYAKKNIKWSLIQERSVSELLKYSFHFFIALLTLSIIGNFDKFYIERQFGKEILGDYFYLANLFIFPFSLLQSYVGFKELVFFKEKFDIKIYNKKIIKINFLGVTLAALLLFCNFLFYKLNYIAVDLLEYKYLIFLFIITGVFKLNYAIQSSAFGAIGEINTIKNANIQSLIVITGISFLSYLLADINSKVEYIALIILLFWLSRMVILKINIRKQVHGH